MKTYVKAAAIAGALTFAASAAMAEMPEKMTWTAYGTTASGYAQSVAIGNALSEAYGVKMRVIPGKNDVSRMAPLRDGKADYCACGIAAFFGQEGTFLFASSEWGPQPLRVVLTAVGENNLSLATAKDANIKTMADLKGKRVSYVVGGDALNWNAAANMAFAGLTWDDVQKVEVSGFRRPSMRSSTASPTRPSCRPSRRMRSVWPPARVASSGRRCLPTTPRAGSA